MLSSPKGVQQSLGAPAFSTCLSTEVAAVFLLAACPPVSAMGNANKGGTQGWGPLLLSPKCLFGMSHRAFPAFQRAGVKYRLPHYRPHSPCPSFPPKALCLTESACCPPALIRLILSGSKGRYFCWGWEKGVKSSNVSQAGLLLAQPRLPAECRHRWHGTGSFLLFCSSPQAWHKETQAWGCMPQCRGI